MAQVPDVRTIAEQIKSRIAHIEDQLKQQRDLHQELDRLREALGRLEEGVTSRVRGRRGQAKPSTPTPAADNAKAAPARRTARRAATATGTPARSGVPRGQTRAAILEALKDGPKTAGEVSESTGIPRATASTTLNKLARSGDVVKAERGYQLPA